MLNIDINLTVGSSAGLLMTSQMSVDEAVFGDIGLSHSLNVKASQQANADLKRKRHKSYGDHIRRRRALSLQDAPGSVGKQRHQSHDGCVDVDGQGDCATPRADVCTNLPDLIQGQVLGNLPNGTGDKDNQIITNGLNMANGLPAGQLPANGEGERVSNGRTFGLEDTVPPDICPVEAGLGKGKGDVSTDTLKSEQLVDLDSSSKTLKDGSLTDESSSVFNDTSNTDSQQDTPTESNTSTPTHGVRTPVTENDPLGFFNQPTQSTPADDTVQTGSGISRNLLLSLGSEGNDSGISSTASGNRSNLLIDIEPFGGSPKKSPAALFSIGSSPERTAQSSKLTMSASVTSSDASSPGSPEPWAPLPQSHSQSQFQTPPSTPTSDIKKASTLPSNLAKLERTQSADIPTSMSASKRGKLVGRSDSFGFGSALRSAASMFSSKFNELKQTMVTPTKGEGPAGATTGSQTSLPKPHEMEKLLYEEEEDMMLRKAGSLDHLGRPTGLSGADDRADGASLDGHLDAVPKIRQQKGYTPFGEFSQFTFVPSMFKWFRKFPFHYL